MLAGIGVARALRRTEGVADHRRARRDGGVLGSARSVERRRGRPRSGGCGSCGRRRAPPRRRGGLDRGVAVGGRQRAASPFWLTTRNDLRSRRQPVVPVEVVRSGRRSARPASRPPRRSPGRRPVGIEAVGLGQRGRGVAAARAAEPARDRVPVRTRRPLGHVDAAEGHAGELTGTGGGRADRAGDRVAGDERRIRLERGAASAGATSSPVPAHTSRAERSAREGRPSEP